MVFVLLTLHGVQIHLLETHGLPGLLRIGSRLLLDTLPNITHILISLAYFQSLFIPTPNLKPPETANTNIPAKTTLQADRYLDLNVNNMIFKCPPLTN